MTRKPLALVRQFFGSLVFDRRTSRYLPFDHEATDLLIDLARRPIAAVLADTPPDDRPAVHGFVDCFAGRGYFGPDERLAADVLEVEVPAGHLVGPLATHVEVIGACNLTCSHCFAGELPRNQNPLSVGELDKLFADLASLGAFRLGLTGGEPLMRKDLFDILDAATARGLHPCLTTNALLIDERIAREFGKRELVWLNISLEGPTAEVNDRVRGEGTFDAVLDRLRILGRHARFTLAFTLMKTNVGMAKACADLAYRVGAHTAVFRPMYPAGTGLHHLDLMPTFGEYTAALHELAGAELPGPELRALDPFGPDTRAESQPVVHTSHGCGAGRHVCSVSVQGDVNPCSFLGPTFNSGNIRETPFPVLWRDSLGFRKMREPSSGFRGGCRARALVFNGSADAPDPWHDEYAGHPAVGCYHPGANVETRRSLPLLPA